MAKYRRRTLWVYIYICVCVCVWVYIYICICTYINRYICYVSVYIYIYYTLSLLTGMFCNIFCVDVRCSLSSICWRFSGWVFQKMLQHKLHWLTCTCLLQKRCWSQIPNKVPQNHVAMERERERERDRIASLSFRKSCSPSPYPSIPQLRAPALWRKLQVQNHRPQLVGIFYQTR